MRHKTILFITALFLCSSVASVATTDTDDGEYSGYDSSTYDDEGFGDTDESPQTPTRIQIVVNRDSLGQSKMYNLNGRRVMSITKKGIYIINGKKVVVR